MGGCFGFERRTVYEIVEKPKWEQVASARGMPRHLPHFALKDKAIVMESWQYLRRSFPDMIEKAFAEMCYRVPQMTQLFGNIDDEDKLQMNYIRHVCEVSFFFDELLLYLPYKRKVAECTFNIGLLHASASVPSWYLDLFLVELIRAAQVCGGQKWTPAVEDAWGVFLKYLCYYMKDALIF